MLLPRQSLKKTTTTPKQCQKHNLRIKLAFLALLGVLALPTQANANWKVIIANQVRGLECCDAGSLENLSLQVKLLRERDLKGTFFVRYDALTDPNFQRILKDVASTHEVGAFLEITPSLAKAAEVEYQGTPENWYKAKHAYLIGYAPAERIRLIDTYMRAFNKLFGFTPKSSSAWMIDAASTSYLKNTYKLNTHQITREQWGTDSYTLHGGPANGVYRSSDNWPLIPTASESGLVIIRQTVADPLMNYGDQTAGFTSQPNDYLPKGRTSSYFVHLADQILPNGPIVLGLENNMETKYQEEFRKQLDWIDSKFYETYSTAEYAAKVAPPPVQLHHSTAEDSLESEAFIITTPRYQLRLRRIAKDVAITDIRLYDESFRDPYFNVQSQSENGYWITPFLLDGSRYSIQQPKPLLDKVLEISGIKPKLPPTPKNLFSPKNDSDVSSLYRLVLPKLKPEETIILKTTPDTISLNSSANSFLLEFKPDSFLLPKATYLQAEKSISLSNEAKQPLYWLPQVTLKKTVDGTKLTWDFDTKPAWWLTITEAAEGQLLFTPGVNRDLDLAALRNIYRAEFDPEHNTLPADLAMTTVYFNNREAIAGRNPVRFLIYPRDSRGLPTKAASTNVNPRQGKIDAISVYGGTSAIEPLWIDLAQSTPGGFTIDISVNGGTLKAEKVRFITNCQKNIPACIKNPLEGFRFARYKIIEKATKALRKVQ